MQDAEAAANCIVCIINQANYLLDRQLQALGKDIINHGDFKDRYKNIQKQKMFGRDDDYDEFLKSQGLRRLENGRVVGLHDADP